MRQGAGECPSYMVQGCKAVTAELPKTFPDEHLTPYGPVPFGHHATQQGLYSQSYLCAHYAPSVFPGPAKAISSAGMPASLSYYAP